MLLFAITIANTQNNDLLIYLFILTLASLFIQLHWTFFNKFSIVRNVPLLDHQQPTSLYLAIWKYMATFEIEIWSTFSFAPAGKVSQKPILYFSPNLIIFIGITIWECLLISIH